MKTALTILTAILASTTVGLSIVADSYSQDISELEEQLEEIKTDYNEAIELCDEVVQYAKEGDDLLENSIQNKASVCSHMTSWIECIDQGYNGYDCTNEYVYPVIDRACEDVGGNII